MIDLQFNQNSCKIKNIFRGYCFSSSVNKQVIDNYGVSGESINLPQNATNQVIRIGTNGIESAFMNGTTYLPHIHGRLSASTTINASIFYFHGTNR
jgi:hypothetical protein